MKPMRVQVGPNRVSLAILQLIAWAGLLGFLVWAEVVFVERWRQPDHHSMIVLSVAVGGLVIAGWLATTAAHLRRRENRLGVGVMPAADETEIDDQDRNPVPQFGPAAVLDESDVASWVHTVNRLLRVEFADRSGDDRPRVALVRAGPSGIEVLFDADAAGTPRRFRALDNGRVWQLDPSIGLDSLLADLDPSDPPLVPVLMRIGEDRSSVFFIAVEGGESVGVAGSEPADTLNRLVTNLRDIPPTEVDLYRLGDAKFEGAESVPSLGLEELRELDRTGFAAERSAGRIGVPVIVADDRGLAELLRERLVHAVLIGAAVEADHLLYRTDDTVTIEPIGLTVRLTESVAREDEGAASSEATADSFVGRELEGMPMPGVIEVRVLREHPDLVGDLEGPSNPVAVQFVAYVAMHGGTVSTSRLRDALGSYRREASRANKTVWSTAGAARQVLGLARIPNATGYQHYELAADVTCDWVRFEEAFRRARSAHAARETARAVSLLTGALDLFEGLPGLDERRFEWLQTEGAVHEIQRVVEEAAHLLVTLAKGSGTVALARWAIDRGRVARPISPMLDQDEMELEEMASLRLEEGDPEPVPVESNPDQGIDDLDEGTQALVSRLADRSDESDDPA